MTPRPLDLKPEKALIWRIVHRENVAWQLKNGLHCRNSEIQDPNYLTIGDPELIVKRSTREVPIPPGGNLGDYVPFYFTFATPMLLNIITGRGVRRFPKDEICIFVSDLYQLKRLGRPFVYTDRHAYVNMAKFYNDFEHLNDLEWGAWQARDFRKDPDNPEKHERYQAETLVFRHVPVEALRGVVCYSQRTESDLARLTAALGLDFKVIVRPDWYFP
jgi:hypothetical protein